MRIYNFNILTLLTVPFFLSCNDSLIDDYISTIEGGGQAEEKAPVEVLATYDWPTEEGQAKISTHYEVYVTLDGEEEKPLEVLQSDPIVNNIQTDGTLGEDPQAAKTKLRTFSFVNVSYDETSGKSLTFRVVSKDGYTNPELAPKSYGINAENSGNSVVFTVDKANRYIAVNFDSPENKVKYNENYEWIKDMLMIFIDPAETVKPNPATQNVVYYSDEVSDAELSAADVIYFKPGYYNLKNNPTGNMINSEGGLTLTSNQQLYLAGGAFVEGHILRRNYGDTNQRFYGRGILSGRQYTWMPGASEEDGRLKELVTGGVNTVFSGIMIMESPNHGIVSRNDCTFENVKMLGWHANNDGFRPGNNSTITNCFLRACDDFFYNYSLNVSDCVLWPAWNGSIMTNGWAGIDIGGSHVENIDIIYPEWFSLLNNKGLLMSQNDYSYNPPAGAKTTTFRNIRFEGKIPGFVNLKPNSNGVGQLTDESELGWMGDVLFEDIFINAHQEGSMNIIKGAENAVIGVANSTWWVRDITFRNVMIGDVKLTNENKDNWFTIDSKTTQNIVFE